MEPVDPALISQLSRRKLRETPSDERRDRNNLRRLVLIQNSLVSISPCASPSRSTPSVDCEQDDAGRDKQLCNVASTSTAAPVEDSYLDDGFGYIFPELSLYNEDDDDDNEVDYGITSNTEAESDWLNAVLSDLDEERALAVETPRNLERSSSPIPIHAGYGGPRYPLPRPPLQLDLPSTSPPSHNAEEESQSALDGLPPYFDADDRSSIYSDESSEPATPFSHSLLGSGLPEPVSSEDRDDVGVVAPRDYSLAHSGLGDDVENRDSRAAVVVMPIPSDVAVDLTERDDGPAVTVFKDGRQRERSRQREHQRQQQLPPDYFLCHHFPRRPYDTF